jgi:hypothetical protein
MLLLPLFHLITGFRSKLWFYYKPVKQVLKRRISEEVADYYGN